MSKPQWKKDFKKSLLSDNGTCKRTLPETIWFTSLVSRDRGRRFYGFTRVEKEKLAQPQWKGTSLPSIVDTLDYSVYPVVFPGTTKLMFIRERKRGSDINVIILIRDFHLQT